MTDGKRIAPFAARAQSSGKPRRLHVKRIALCLSSVLLFAACENSTDPLGGIINGGGGALTAAQATGDWTFSVQVNATLPACSNPLTNGQGITAHLDVLSDGTVATTSSWTNPISGGGQPLGGFITLSSGSTDLLFAAPSVSSSAQMELFGTMTSTGSFTGTLTDPEAGFSQVFGTGGCAYAVTGAKG